jgi:hypothetical protein
MYLGNEKCFIPSEICQDLTGYCVGSQTYRVIKKEVYTFKNLFYKYYWTYGDILYIEWRENSQSYFHTLQALDVNPTCDAADVKKDNPALPTLVAACHR